MQPPKDKIPAEIVHQRLNYNATTGLLFWKSSPRTGFAGKIAGNKRKDGYIQIRINGQCCLAHRLAFVCMTGRWPELGLDHINGDTSDNRWVNLREADSDQNHWNMKIFSNNTSGYRGVTLHRKTGKWVAEIWHKRKKYHLGLFPTKESASQAHELARSRMFGEFNRSP